MKVAIFEMERLFGSCLVCCHCFCLGLDVCLEILLWLRDVNYPSGGLVSKVFWNDGEGGWCGSWVGEIPSMVPACNSSKQEKSQQQSWVRIYFRAGEVMSAEWRCRGSERGNSLRQSSNPEWKKSHCGVTGVFISGLLSPPSGVNSVSGCIDRELDVAVKMCKHKHTMKHLCKSGKCSN